LLIYSISVKFALLTYLVCLQIYIIAFDKSLFGTFQSYFGEYIHSFVVVISLLYYGYY